MTQHGRDHDLHERLNVLNNIVGEGEGASNDSLLNLGRMVGAGRREERGLDSL